MLLHAEGSLCPSARVWFTFLYGRLFFCSWECCNDLLCSSFYFVVLNVMSDRVQSERLKFCPTLFIQRCFNASSIRQIAWENPPPSRVLWDHIPHLTNFETGFIADSSFPFRAINATDYIAIDFISSLLAVLKPFTASGGSVVVEQIFLKWFILQ